MKYMMTAEEVAKELGVSKGYAYKIIKKMNNELVKDGFIVISGKVPRAFWKKKFFGIQTITDTEESGEEKR